MFTETAHGTDFNGKKFTETLLKKGIVPGIKVDKGTADLEGTNKETWTKGLDSLAQFCHEHYAIGCRFAKWRAVLKIGDGLPSEQAI